MKSLHFLAAAAMACAVLSTNAQTTPAPGADNSTANRAAAAPLSEGEVRKVDVEQGKVTLRHGPLTNLDMPAMTMVFRVADPKFLDGLALRNITADWGRAAKEWREAMNQFAIAYGDRFMRAAV